MKTVTVSLTSGFKYQQTITNGTHTAISDVSVADGGGGAALNPKELALGALGACIAMTILMVAGKKNWDIQTLSVTVTQTDEPDPNSPGKKRLVVTESLDVKGNLTQQELDDIKATAAKCPVYKLMTESKRMETQVTHSQ